jgi:hypothetical protein
MEGFAYSDTCNVCIGLDLRSAVTAWLNIEILVAVERAAAIAHAFVVT